MQPDATPSFDRAWAAALAASCAAAYREQTAGWPEEPALPPPVECALAADQAIDTAILTRVLGAGADDVRPWWLRAAGALARLLEQPGGAPAIPLHTVDDDGALRPDRPRGDGRPAPVDRSLTGSARSLLALQAALLADDEALVERVARRVDGRRVPSRPDRPSAEDEARRELALAIAAWLRGETAVAAFHAVGATNAGDLGVQGQARGLMAIIDDQAPRLASALRGLLDARAVAAGETGTRREPRRLVSLPALALAALARRAGQAEPAAPAVEHHPEGRA